MTETSPGNMHTDAGSASAQAAQQLKDHKAQILRKRKLALTTVRQGAIAEESIGIVEFLLGTDSYGFELEHLREVCPLTGLTPIPWSPLFVLGVINLRGQLIPIIDVKVFLGGESPGTPVFNKAIILQQDDLVVGVMADEVLGATNIPIKQLQYTVELLCGIRADYIRAVTSSRLIILNAAKILGDQRLNQNPVQAQSR